MSKQQTAVEWLEKEISTKLGTNDLLDDLYKQAKAMEKEQMINTWSEATAPDHEIGLSDASYIISQIQKAEQYFQETYGGEQ
jgi:hypothetical protein